MEKTRLTILGEGKRNKWNQRTFDCLCLCGTRKDIYISNITSGKTKSCGCLNAEKVGKRAKKMFTIHGDHNTPFYNSWRGMRERCSRSSSDNYSYYGGRGIKYDVNWDNYLNFKKDMYRSYLYHVKKHGQKQTTLDRIDVNGNYCKENCRWATKSEQTKNQRKNVKII